MEKKALAKRFRAETTRHRKEVCQFLADIDRKIDYLVELHREFRNTINACRCSSIDLGGDAE